MEFQEVLRGRRSIRAFTDEAVPPDVVAAVLDDARWSPSWGNAQAWSVTVVRGKALTNLTETLSAEVRAGLPTTPDIPMPLEWPEDLKKRMNIRRPASESESPQPAPRASVWQAWGAPTLLLFAVDDRIPAEYACFDTGLLVQSVCLAAFDRGLGTCIEAMMVRYPDVLHDLFPQAAHTRFVVGVALGHVDETSPVNEFPRDRIALEEFVTWAD